ncbi:hypothetical protein RND71_004078 [Anisodus tanguticus]|uniref:DUF7138 domain-containing protein n=1 Tax=Anisodus tanguticus TaxID=243964 RepID=A0AAE1VQL7_9SOLA|nr:hypothetical protein RND71_004078 [Anisodus tanguticus]
MVEVGKGSVFPVIFFDGEREINIGNIRVQPTLVFKPFQLMLSERIGISPNQISIYVCDRKGSKFEDRQKIPVTSKANFAVISREKHCFFLLVLKRSRKSRNRKTTPLIKENVFLLRRNSPELVSMNERVQNLQIQREKFDLVLNKSDLNMMHLDSPSSSEDSRYFSEEEERTLL